MVSLLLLFPLLLLPLPPQVHYLLSSKLDSLLTSGRVTRLLEAVEEAVFSPGQGLEEQEDRLEERTLEAFRAYLPSLLARWPISSSCPPQSPTYRALGKSFQPSTQTVVGVLQVW